MIPCENLCFFFTLMTLSLSSSRTCSLSTSFLGRWRQAGLADLITINETWFSSKGLCLNKQEEITNKLIYSNEQTRCKRCILFISRHFNVLQYRESECFDTDDDDNDHSRICASITPDSVLYTLFRDDAKSIPCSFNQTWSFKRNQHLCQPKAFHKCLDQDTFRIVYNQQCLINQNEIAQCFAQFSDGSMTYILSRSVNREKLICFSYLKNSFPNEIYFSKDETCRNLLTKDSTIKLHLLLNKKHIDKQLSIQIPNWIEGIWFSMNNEIVSINQTHIHMNMNNNRKTLQIIQIRQEQHQKNIFLRTQIFEQCSAKFHCIHLIYRSPSVIDFSFDKHGCRHSSIHYTLFKPTNKTDSSCPDAGIYKSLNTYHSTLSITACSMSLWQLTIGCQKANQSDLVLSSSCHHPIIPEVQVITSIEGRCLATWRTDHRFQRTLVQYEQSKAFCLIQPLESRIASWILSELSCTHINLSSIQIENSFPYLHTCQSSSSSSSATIFNLSLFLLLFYLTIQINI